jgi:hypothetical protein
MATRSQPWIIASSYTQDDRERAPWPPTPFLLISASLWAYQGLQRRDDRL